MSKTENNLPNDGSDGCCTLDRELNIIESDNRLEEYLGLNQCLIGRKCFNAFQGRNSPCPGCPVNKVYAVGESQSYDLHYPNFENPERLFHITLSPLRDEQGRIVGAHQHFRNLVDIFRVEGELRKSQPHLESIIEAMPSIL